MDYTRLDCMGPVVRISAWRVQDQPRVHEAQIRTRQVRWSRLSIWSIDRLDRPAMHQVTWPNSRSTSTTNIEPLHHAPFYHEPLCHNEPLRHEIMLISSFTYIEKYSTRPSASKTHEKRAPFQIHFYPRNIHYSWKTRHAMLCIVHE